MAERVRWREVSWFLALAIGMCSVISLLVWLFGGERTVSLAAMLTPALAALVVVWRSRGRAAIPRATSMTPVRPLGRTVRWCLLGLLLLAGVGLLTALFAAATGVIELDLQNFSMLRTELAATFPGQVAADGTGFPAGWPLLGWLALQLGGVFAIAGLAFGEELGWRGYLFPALLPLGVWAAMLVTGAVWIIWHLPLILLGNYQGSGDLAGYMLVFVLGNVLPQTVLITWLRLASGSVWPAVMLHASASMLFTVVTMVAAAGTSVNPSLEVGGQQVPISSIVMIACAVALLLPRRAGIRRHAAAVRTAAPHPGDYERATSRNV
ncbi:CPBP family intramembrane glutamic endopeptidase [Bounagaea algeriensis]